MMIDEAHERDVDMDLVLVTLRRMVIDGRTSSKRVPKVIIMSATVDAAPHKDYFGGDPAVIDVPGRTVPVALKFLEDAERALPPICRSRARTP